MKKLSMLVFLFGFIFPALIFAQESSFFTNLKTYSLTFKMPSGFKEMPVIKNHDVVYDYAVSYETGTFEIRYRIWPIDTSTPPPNEKRINQNNIFPSMHVAMLLNISGGGREKHSFFHPSDVKKEFNADAGATGITNVNSEFGKGYSGCMVNVIHRDNLADVYIFFLFKDVSELKRALLRDDVFHALKFKSP